MTINYEVQMKNKSENDFNFSTILWYSENELEAAEKFLNSSRKNAPEYDYRLIKITEEVIG